jgi:hypothetical protein
MMKAIKDENQKIWFLRNTISAKETREEFINTLGISNPDLKKQFVDYLELYSKMSDRGVLVTNPFVNENLKKLFESMFDIFCRFMKHGSFASERQMMFFLNRSRIIFNFLNWYDNVSEMYQKGEATKITNVKFECWAFFKQSTGVLLGNGAQNKIDRGVWLNVSEHASDMVAGIPKDLYAPFLNALMLIEKENRNFFESDETEIGIFSKFFAIDNTKLGLTFIVRKNEVDSVFKKDNYYGNFDLSGNIEVVHKDIIVLTNAKLQKDEKHAKPV